MVAGIKKQQADLAKADAKTKAQEAQVPHDVERAADYANNAGLALLRAVIV